MCGGPKPPPAEARSFGKHACAPQVRPAEDASRVRRVPFAADPRAEGCNSPDSSMAQPSAGRSLSPRVSVCRSPPPHGQRVATRPTARWRSHRRAAASARGGPHVASARASTPQAATRTRAAPFARRPPILTDSPRGKPRIRKNLSIFTLRNGPPQGRATARKEDETNQKTHNEP